jgi:microcystin-dependent protein
MGIAASLLSANVFAPVFVPGVEAAGGKIAKGIVEASRNVSADVSSAILASSDRLANAGLEATDLFAKNACLTILQATANLANRAEELERRFSANNLIALDRFTQALDHIARQRMIEFNNANREALNSALDTLRQQSQAWQEVAATSSIVVGGSMLAHGFILLLALVLHAYLTSHQGKEILEQFLGATAPIVRDYLIMFLMACGALLPVAWLAHVYQVNRCNEALWKIKMQLELAARAVPVGTVTPFAGRAPPPGWLLCDGAAIDPVDNPHLATLYQVLRAAQGDNPRLPDLRNRFVLGASDTRPVGSAGGAFDTTLTIEQLPAHDHGGNTRGANDYPETIRAVSPHHADEGAHNLKVEESRTMGWFYGNGYRDFPPGTVRFPFQNHNHPLHPQGGGQAFSITPPYIALIYIIKY